MLSLCGTTAALINWNHPGRKQDLCKKSDGNDDRPGDECSEQVIQKAVSKGILMPTTYTVLQVQLQITSVETL